MIPRIASKPSQLKRDDSSRAGVERNSPEAIKKDDQNLSDEKESDNQIPPQDIPGDGEIFV